jgi:hypothetical protein
VSWQWATVTANYGGNWTALFCTGALRPQPPLAAAEHIYLFAGSTGYDGQLYHYVAHDPFLRTDLQTYVDDPRLRYRRVLIPLLAYGLALGHSRLIDPAYEIACLLSIGLGVFWSCRLALKVELRAAWGLLFLCVPAIPIAIDRLVIDGALAALTVAFIYYSGKPSWKLFVVLICAVLTRETGFLLVLAYCAHLVWRREFRTASVFLLSALPALAWYLYVQVRTVATPSGIAPMPFSSILTALSNPWKYPSGTPFPDAVRAADYLALAGAVLAFAFAVTWFVRKASDPVRITAVLFASMGIVLQRTEHWENVYHFGRIYTPLLLCLLATGAQYRKVWLAAPVAMMLPRLAIQLAPQAVGVFRWMT